MEGYIKLHRSLLDNPIMVKADYLAIWIYILLKASHKEHDQLIGNQIIHLLPGQFPTGRKKISKDLGISENKIYRALNYFEIEHQIKQQKNNKFTVITILNWRKYQGNSTTNEQQNEQQLDNKSTTNEQQLDTNKNDKNVKNDKNKDILSFWNLKKIIIHKDNKDMLNQIRIGIDKYGKEKIELAINRYKEIKDSSFFYSSIWRLDDFLKQSNGVPAFLDDGKIWVNYQQWLKEQNYKLGIQKETSWNETKKAQLAQRDKDQAKDPLYYQALQCAKTKNYICNANKNFDICVICEREKLIK